jgi:hypothetical protein
MHGNQEIPVLPAAVRKRRAGRGTHKGNPFMDGTGKSDCRVVPKKVLNKGDPRGGNLRRFDHRRRSLAGLIRIRPTSVCI